jgi:3-hydroxyacyl-CoA dehydrogenase/enoyl-CoA hydratase/3-hydroxybutyryl-CoA epimerase
VRRRTYGNYPSVTAIENAVFDGLFVPMDTALKIEVRYFVQLLAGPNSRNMVRTNFLNFQKANKMARRPAAVPRREIRKLGVLGDGATDLAIARMAIKAGIEILSVPIEDAAADYDMLREADIIIGAVSEDGRIRADAIRRAEAASGRNGVFASTSSAAAIGEAAVSFGRPERFVGLHLIRNLAGPPQIVEVVPGRQTGDVALTLAMDFARQLRKTPIVMGDARGFYVDRIIAAYLDEALRLLAEGVAPALIENAGLAIGMATGPLALADDFSLPATRRMIVGLAGGGRRNAVAEGVLDALAITTARSGSGNGTGFYDHRKDAPAELWSGLSTFVVPPRKQPDVDIVKERLLTIQVLEATRCLEEKIVFEAADADVAAVIGFSFAPWTGGPLSYIDTVGVNRFVQCAERLAGQYGPRFEPPSLLRSMAANSDRFYAAAVATRPPSQVRSKSDAERVLADQPQGG